MLVEIRQRPAYAVAYVILGFGERVFVERDGMVAMSKGVHVTAGIGGTSIGRAVMRQVAARENVVFSRFEADLEGAWVAVAPPYPGDMTTVALSPGVKIRAEQGSIICYSEGVEVGWAYAGMAAVLVREGVTFALLSGDGVAVLGSYGAVEEVELDADESVVVDSGHLVAFTDGMKFQAGMLGSLTTSVLSGEGLVAEITGPGKVWVQTRAKRSIQNWLFPERPQNG